MLSPATKLHHSVGGPVRCSNCVLGGVESACRLDRMPCTRLLMPYRIVLIKMYLFDACSLLRKKYLGAFWVAKGKAATRAPAGRRTAADRATTAAGRAAAMAVRRGALADATAEAAARAAEVVAAREQRVEARGGRAIARCERGVTDASSGEAARPRTRASQGVGVSGAIKRDCGAGSPSGATIAAREAEEVEACRSRAQSTRARRLNLGSGIGE